MNRKLDRDVRKLEKAEHARAPERRQHWYESATASYGSKVEISTASDGDFLVFPIRLYAPMDLRVVSFRAQALTGGAGTCSFNVALYRATRPQNTTKEEMSSSPGRFGLTKRLFVGGVNSNTDLSDVGMLHFKLDADYTLDPDQPHFLVVQIVDASDTEFFFPLKDSTPNTGYIAAYSNTTVGAFPDDLQLKGTRARIPYFLLRSALGVRLWGDPRQPADLGDDSSDAPTNLPGTTNISWTVNTDATTANEDPEYHMLGGSGSALIDTVLTQDSSASLAYFHQTSNGSRIAPTIGIGVPGSTSSFGATLRFHGGSGAAALTEDIVLYHVGSGIAGLRFTSQMSCPGAGANSERFGDQCVAAGTNATAFGNGASASNTNCTVFGLSCVANATGASAYGAAASAAGDNSCVFGAGSSTSSGGDEALVFGRSSSTSAVAIIIANSYSNTTANVCVLGSPTTPINTLIVGEGDNDATPPNTTWRPSNAAALNQNGGDWSFIGSRSRGSGTSGFIEFLVGDTGASSGTLNNTLSRMKMNTTGIGFFGSAPVAKQTAPTPNVAELLAGLQALGLFA